MKNILANAFDTVADIYSEARPGYPESIYKRVECFKTFYNGSTLLEIGSGHGVATEEIFSFWGSNIVAIEPGESLCSLAKNKLKKYPRIKFINCSFEEFQSSEKFDGIYSATAFHWINPSIKFHKTHELLKDNGLLFLFWNNYSIHNENLFNEIQSIYKIFHPHGISNKDIRIIQKEKIEARKKEIVESGLFKLLSHDEIIHTLIYSTERYIKLLKSFSNNAISGDEMNPFYDQIKECIYSHRNEIKVKIIINLEIAEKLK